ncbi:PP2C-domain-containing protein [Dacryopinax primogenitus]|uniref:protein-serine/threonine phosphatase n=1 Tax=Dacryopinax primogenitus (strain DJM 731) TaxID=1858805 RepID=M5GAU6_DACPD|nr:PP2C-domain-containing protein [Dacryopinax primogenitus]EJU03102.1 PP2C-domain-containing protein [Dacryopinax primogenitus]
MGQTLSSPATEKTTDEGRDERFAYGVTEMQGWRITMEDAHTTVLNVDDVEGEEEKHPSERVSFFAVFDGHGGATVAKFAGKTVHTRLAEQEEYQNKDYRGALKYTFLRTDEALRADPMFRNDPSGCTAIACLVTPENKIWAANAGDSRAVLCDSGRVKPLSYDHKPNGTVEYARIMAAGGWVEYGRVNGNLALSRALGDFEYKKNLSLAPERQIVTSDPDIMSHEISEEDEFIVLACDGIWDCMSSQSVCDYVRRHVAHRMPLGKICESLVDYCIAPDADLEKSGIGCDNMTVIIIAILHGRTLEEWYDWIVDRVERGFAYPTPSEFKPLYGPRRGYSWDFTRSNTGRLAFDLRIPSSYVDDSSDEEMEESEIGHGMFRSAAKGKGEEVLGKGKGREVRDLDIEVAELEETYEWESDDSGEDATLPPGFTSTRLTSLGRPLVAGPPELKNLGAAHFKPEKQLVHTPEGDAPSPAVLVEGLMDTSEDPTKIEI